MLSTETSISSENSFDTTDQMRPSALARRDGISRQAVNMRIKKFIASGMIITVVFDSGGRILTVSAAEYDRAIDTALSAAKLKLQLAGDSVISQNDLSRPRLIFFYGMLAAVAFMIGAFLLLGFAGDYFFKTRECFGLAAAQATAPNVGIGAPFPRGRQSFAWEAGNAVRRRGAGKRGAAQVVEIARRVGEGNPRAGSLEAA
jgi:hypothetical protein